MKLSLTSLGRDPCPYVQERVCSSTIMSNSRPVAGRRAEEAQNIPFFKATSLELSVTFHLQVIG